MLESEPDWVVGLKPVEMIGYTPYGVPTIHSRGSSGEAVLHVHNESISHSRSTGTPNPWLVENMREGVTYGSWVWAAESPRGATASLSIKCHGNQQPGDSHIGWMMKWGQVTTNTNPSITLPRRLHHPPACRGLSQVDVPRSRRLTHGQDAQAPFGGRRSARFVRRTSPPSLPPLQSPSALPSLGGARLRGWRRGLGGCGPRSRSESGTAPRHRAACPRLR